MRGIHEAPGVSYCLGKSESFFPKSPTLGEPAELSMARGECGMDKRGGQDRMAEALVAPCPLEEPHGLPEAIDGLTIVALGLIGEAEALARQLGQDGISASRGEREGALGGGDGLVIYTPDEEMD